jgi:CIC family chloride channel protein
MGVGYETINASLTGSEGAGLLVLVLGAKFLATCLSLGSGGSGGVFAPSLLLGAALGPAFGQGVHQWFPGWTAEPGAYALVGMGAVVSAATHAPITAILIIFELTNDYRTIPRLMLACVVGVLLSSRLHRESIYTEKLARRGVRLWEGRDVNLLRSLRVGEVMETSVQTVGAGQHLADVLQVLLAGSRPSAVVVEADGRYLGCVDLSDVREVLPQSEDLVALVVAADVADHQTPFVVPADRLDGVMRLLGSTHRDELPVCDSATNRRVVGVVTKRAVIDAYNRRLFQADLSGGFGSVVGAVAEGRSVEILPGVCLSELELPGSWVGQSLQEADPRRRFGLEIVLVRRLGGDAVMEPDEGGSLFPSPGLVFRHGDRLLVMGAADALERARKDEAGASR